MTQAHADQSPIVQGAFVRAARVYAKEARCEIVSLIRERPYIFSVLGLPTIFYLVFGIAHSGEILQGQPISRYLLASYSSFGAMGAAMFAVGVGLVMERSHGWLELKRASPMPVHAYLSAKIAASLAFGELIAIVLLALGYALSGLHISPADTLRFMVAIAGGVLAFSTIGTLLGLLLSPGPPWVSSTSSTSRYLSAVACGCLLRCCRDGCKPRRPFFPLINLPVSRCMPWVTP